MASSAPPPPLLLALCARTPPVESALPGRALAVVGREGKAELGRREEVAEMGRECVGEEEEAGRVEAVGVPGVAGREEGVAGREVGGGVAPSAAGDMSSGAGEGDCW